MEGWMKLSNFMGFLLPDFDPTERSHFNILQGSILPVDSQIGTHLKHVHNIGSPELLKSASG